MAQRSMHLVGTSQHWIALPPTFEGSASPKAYKQVGPKRPLQPVVGRVTPAMKQDAVYAMYHVVDTTTVGVWKPDNITYFCIDDLLAGDIYRGNTFLLLDWEESDDQLKADLGLPRSVPTTVYDNSMLIWNPWTNVCGLVEYTDAGQHRTWLSPNLRATPWPATTLVEGVVKVQANRRFMPVFAEDIRSSPSDLAADLHLQE